MSATVSRPAADGWLRLLLRRRPHQVVGTAYAPYLVRWFVLPRNRFLNVYLQTIASSGLLKHFHGLRAGKFVELRRRVGRPGPSGWGAFRLEVER